jgi:hypothetical protein
MAPNSDGLNIKLLNMHRKGLAQITGRDKWSLDIQNYFLREAMVIRKFT